MDMQLATDELADRFATTPARVAYLTTWFPKLSETFVLNEMRAVERQGVQIELFPLRRGREKIVHAEAAEFVRRARYTPTVSLAIAWDLLRTFVTQPLTMLATLTTCLWANLGSRRYLAGALMYFPKAVHLACQMQRLRIQHIHAHFASHPALVAFVIHRLTGIPFSFTAHGSDLHRDQHMLREKVREAAFVVTISEFNRRVIHNVCGGHCNDKIMVVHCGVDTNAFRRAEQANASHTAAPSGITIYCVGTMHEVKGQTYLLRAVRKVIDQHRSVQLHFIGDGPDLAKCRQLSNELGLNDVTTFHGHMRRSDVLMHLAHADIVVAPSVPTRDGRCEGIPVALMEAMASGAAVVASRLSGIPELVRDELNGLLVAPGDVDGIAQAIDRLIVDSSLRRALAMAARQTVVEDFNQELSARQLATAFLGVRRPMNESTSTNITPACNSTKEVEQCF